MGTTAHNLRAKAKRQKENNTTDSNSNTAQQKLKCLRTLRTCPHLSIFVQFWRALDFCVYTKWAKQQAPRPCQRHGQPVLRHCIPIQDRRWETQHFRSQKLVCNKSVSWPAVSWPDRSTCGCPLTLPHAPLAQLPCVYLAKGNHH